MKAAQRKEYEVGDKVWLSVRATIVERYPPPPPKVPAWDYTDDDWERIQSGKQPIIRPERFGVVIDDKRLSTMYSQAIEVDASEINMLNSFSIGDYVFNKKTGVFGEVVGVSPKTIGVHEDSGNISVWPALDTILFTDLKKKGEQP